MRTGMGAVIPVTMGRTMTSYSLGKTWDESVLDYLQEGLNALTTDPAAMRKLMDEVGKVTTDSTKFLQSLNEYEKEYQSFIAFRAKTKKRWGMVDPTNILSVMAYAPVMANWDHLRVWQKSIVATYWYMTSVQMYWVQTAHSFKKAKRPEANHITTMTDAIGFCKDKVRYLRDPQVEGVTSFLPKWDTDEKLFSDTWVKAAERRGYADTSAWNLTTTDAKAQPILQKEWWDALIYAVEATTGLRLPTPSDTGSGQAIAGRSLGAALGIIIAIGVVLVACGILMAAGLYVYYTPYRDIANRNEAYAKRMEILTENHTEALLRMDETIQKCNSDYLTVVSDPARSSQAEQIKIRCNELVQQRADMVEKFRVDREKDAKQNEKENRESRRNLPTNILSDVKDILLYSIGGIGALAGLYIIYKLGQS